MRRIIMSNKERKTDYLGETTIGATICLYFGIMMIIFMMLKMNQMTGVICISPLDYIFNSHLIEKCLKEEEEEEKEEE